MSDHPPRRVRIVAPRMRATRTGPNRPVSSEIGEQTVVGDLYMGSLVRVQLRLAIGVLLIFTGLLGGIPLLLVVEPQLAHVEAFGIPLPWLLLGFVVHPALIAGGLLFVRQAERNEHDFSEAVR